ncbi:unnamed protein product [Rodentolepis nana]|uniref:Tetraspanin n=1 Tax=Rodentolepis nana TaxID=102285 RepID=A0A0R3T036_RODNA|nr:unnamed protein product [Rodentolepis nana]
MDRHENGTQRDRLLAENNQDSDVKNKSSCCSLTPSWIKTFLIFFTLIIMAIALAFIGLGIYFSIIRNPLLPVLMGETVYINTYLFIGLGILLVLVCIFGFVAISKNSPPMLKLYAIVLAIALILHLCVATAALLYYHFGMQWNAEALSNIMKNEYHLQDNDVTRAVDELQKQYKCCGSRNYHDWQWSGFENNSKLVTRENSSKPSIVPNSCCIGFYPECGKLTHPSNIYYKYPVEVKY